MFLGIVTVIPPMPISDYINNPVFQELLLESDFFGTESNEKSILICRTASDIQVRLKN